MTGSGLLVTGLLITLVPAVLYVAALWLIDPYEREPIADLGLMLGAGVVIVPLITAAVEAVLAIPQSVYPVAFAVFASGPPNFGGAVVEEAAKALIVLAAFVVFRREFDDTLDGLIYGAVIGAGFALAESIVYLRTLASLGGAAQFSPGFLLAIFVSGLSQCFFTAVFGASLGYVRESAPGRWWIPAAGFAAAALYHAGYVGLGYLAATPPGAGAWAAWAGWGHRAVDWFGVLVIGVMVRWAWEREREIFSRTLPDEVATGAVTAAELAYLTAGQRVGRQMLALRRAGWGHYLALRRLHQAQAELAFAKWRQARSLGGDEEITRQREEIRRLRGRVPGAGR